jgi:hypothetical protein
MLEVYVDQDQEISFAFFVVNEKVCKKVLNHIKENFGYNLEKSEEDEEEFIEIGEFLKDTLMVYYKDMNEDFLELGEKIDLHIISKKI